MLAARLLARAELRRRWRSLVVLGVLAGLVCGVVLAAVLGARRTATAFDRLRSTTAYWDAELEDVPEGLVDDITSLPQVEEHWLQSFDVGRVTSREQVTFVAVQAGAERPPGYYEPIVVEGRMSDPAALDELVVSEQAATVLDLSVGDTFDFAGASPEQFAGFERGIVPNEPEGGRVTFEVVGVVQDPLDPLPSPTLRLLATPAYERALGDQTGGVALLTVRLADGAAGLAPFREEVAALTGPAEGGTEAGGGLEVTSVHDARVVVDRATSVGVQALLAFGFAAGAAGLVAVSQAVVRNLLGPASDLPTWSAVGATTRERLVALVLPRILLVAVGVAVAAAVAVAVSPLTPVGLGRSIEPSPGLEASWGLLALGSVGVALVLLAVVVGCAAFTLWRSSRRRSHPPRRPGVAAGAILTGAPLPLVLGARFALEPGSGRAAVPTRSAAAGAVIGVAGLVAVGTTAVTLDRLVSTPDRYGWGHDVGVVDVEDELVAPLLEDERHASVVLVDQVEVTLGGEDVLAFGLDVRKGGLDLPVLSGRPPGGPSEVALGPTVLDRLDVGEGDVIEAATPGGGTRSLQVVGTVLTEDPEDFASSAVLTAEGLRELAPRSPSYRLAWLTWADGVDVEAAVQELGREKELALPEVPADVANLSQAREVLRVLAVFLGVLALVATAHAVLVSARRRRRELGVLRALGVTGAQLARAVRWMALVLLGIGLVGGIPLGLVAAGFVWGRLAASVGVAGGLDVPVALAALVPAAAVAGILIAIPPASRAARLAAADALRVE